MSIVMVMMLVLFVFLVLWRFGRFRGLVVVIPVGIIIPFNTPIRVHGTA